MITIAVDVQQMIRDLEEVGRATEDAVFTAMQAAGEEIALRFRMDQLSGRSGDNKGLNIITGRLHSSVTSEAMIAAGKVHSLIKNEGARYWYWHQIGSGNLPKRLFFDEFFEEKGPDIYTTMIEEALSKVA
jgi:hypothetical protein